MKKFIKASVSLLLVFSILLSFSVSSLAESNASIATSGDAINTDESNETVATISLCSCIYLFPISGHTWIYVHNRSDSPIKVGLYEVPVGEGVSIGCYAFTAYDGFGIYYNLEAYRENKNDNMDTHWSVSKDLNQEELDKLTRNLIRYPNTWDFTLNCATFAFSIWNSVSGDAYFSLLIPAISQIMVIIGGGKKGVLEMYYPRQDQVFRQRGTGDNAYLEPVGERTINR